MDHIEHICGQCFNKFETWARLEDYSTGEIIDFQLVEETDFCSEECRNEWRLDNRAELCN